LRLGDPQTLTHCTPSARSETWPVVALGLGGGRLAVAVLLELAERGKPPAEVLLALGLLGDLSAVATLLACLTNPEVAPAAATALQLITGASLFEKAFIPDKIDEDELFPAELEKLKEGEPLTGPGGRPLGTTVTRLAQNPLTWQTWWHENRARFDPRIRYRNGKPYSPACLIENLDAEQSPYQVRQYAAEELVIRYGCKDAFETDMFVVRQKQVLAGMGQWVQANAGRFRDGAWYFAGQALPM
jgi:hypothetical protein